jgi:hypothetical protein
MSHLDKVIRLNRDGSISTIVRQRSDATEIWS